MGKSKITITFEEMVAAYQSWWDEYKLDPSACVDYDSPDYDDSNYAVDSANTMIKHINKIKGE